jgi:F420-non-reducing hydrogenase small subunit
VQYDEELYGSIYDKDEVVFRQGDRGDTMYVIQHGAVEVSRRSEDKDTVLSLLEKGDFFGEMALIDDRTRSATVRTLCRCRLLALTRSSLLSRLRKDPGVALHLLDALSKRIESSNLLLRKSVEYDGASPSSRIISNGKSPSIDPEEIKAQHNKLDILHNELMNNLTDITGQTEQRHFRTGETIFSQDESSKEMYIISEGLVEISHTAIESQYVLAHFGSGDLFGEMSLITDRPRTASAKAKKDTRVLVFNRQNLLEGLSKKTELGLLILQLMIVRLRRTFLSVANPDNSLELKSYYVPALSSKGGKITINFVSLSACSGCAEGLLQDESELNRLLESANISYSTLLTDHETIGYADITIVDGAVRSREDEEKLLDVRGKSRFVVAWGSCSAYGGIPVYANQYDLEELIEEAYGHALDPFSYYLSGNKGTGSISYQQNELELLRNAGKADDFIRVDYYLPGCPPHISLLTQLMGELSGQCDFQKAPGIVCAECSRKPFKCPDQYYSHYPGENCDSSLCINAQGVLCLGFLTRGGCRAVCPQGGLPCWCCRGPSDISLKKMSSGGSLEKVLTDSLYRRCKIPSDKIEAIVNSLCKKGNSMLRFDHYFTHNRERIR